MNLIPFPLSFLALVILMSCVTKSQDTLSTKEITAAEADTHQIMEHYTLQMWCDNFLSDDKKDTLVVQLWSGVQNRYLDSIPVDSTMDWWAWFQRNDVEAVLSLKDIKPLHIRNSHCLYYCTVLHENGKRAIAIVPGACQPSNLNVCEIYIIQNNNWVLLQKFSLLSDFLVDEDGGGPEFTSKWLVKSKGRWMYRDYGNYFAEVDTNYHYVFTKI